MPDLLTFTDFENRTDISGSIAGFETDFDRYKAEEVIMLNGKLGVESFDNLNDDEQTIYNGMLSDLIFLRFVWTGNVTARDQIYRRFAPYSARPVTSTAGVIDGEPDNQRPSYTDYSSGYY